MTEMLATTDRGGDLVLDSGELSRNPAAVYLASLAQGSRRAMVGALGAMAGILQGKGPEDLPSGREEQLGAALACQWGALRYQHTAALRARLAEAYSAATANRMLSALRGVLKAAWRLGQIGAEDYARATDLQPVTGETLPAGRALTPGELDALLMACANDATAAGARDAAMIAVGYSCGLRRAEIVGLQLSNYNPTTGALEVHGKRNKDRLAHVVNGAAAALRDWLAIRGDAPGALFCPVNKGGRVILGAMTSQAFYNALSKRAAEAGVTATSPHDLRRTFVGDLLDAGADIVTVQHMAGHASPTTTARYDRRPEAAKRKAAELLHVPYRGRRML